MRVATTAPSTAGAPLPSAGAPAVDGFGALLAALLPQPGAQAPGTSAPEGPTPDALRELATPTAPEDPAPAAPPGPSDSTDDGTADSADDSTDPVVLPGGELPIPSSAVVLAQPVPVTLPGWPVAPAVATAAGTAASPGAVTEEPAATPARLAGAVRPVTAPVVRPTPASAPAATPVGTDAPAADAPATPTSAPASPSADIAAPAATPAGTAPATGEAVEAADPTPALPTPQTGAPTTDVPPTDRAAQPTGAGPAAADPSTTGPATGPTTGPATGPISTAAAPAVVQAAAPAPAAGPAGPSSVAHQVFEKIDRLATSGDGTHRVTLRLDPGTLGEVRVVLTVRDGRVRVRLSAGDEARVALTQGVPDLQRLLQAHRSGEVRVDVTAFGATTQPGQQPDAQSGQQAGPHDPSGTRAGHGDTGTGTGHHGAPARTRGATTARDGAQDRVQPPGSVEPRRSTPLGVDVRM